VRCTIKVKRIFEKLKVNCSGKACFAVNSKVEQALNRMAQDKLEHYLFSDLKYQGRFSNLTAKPCEKAKMIYYNILTVL
jgi:hypothetical protein